MTVSVKQNINNDGRSNGGSCSNNRSISRSFPIRPVGVANSLRAIS